MTKFFTFVALIDIVSAGPIMSQGIDNNVAAVIFLIGLNAIAGCVGIGLVAGACIGRQWDDATKRVLK